MGLLIAIVGLLAHFVGSRGGSRQVCTALGGPSRVMR